MKKRVVRIHTKTKSRVLFGYYSTLKLSKFGLTTLKHYTLKNALNRSIFNFT